MIAQGQTGTSQANDYIDQRNQLLQQLSGYMNISYFTDSNNMVDVLTSQGTSLVDGMASYQLTKEQDPTTGMTSVGWQGPSGGAQDITGQIQGGSLGALLTTRDSTIPGYLNNLNGLAQSIVQNVNYFHEQGNDDAGIPFFQSSSTDCAQNISLATRSRTARARSRRRTSWHPLPRRRRRTTTWPTRSPPSRTRPFWEGTRSRPSPLRRRRSPWGSPAALP